MKKLQIFDSPEKALKTIPLNSLKKVRTKDFTLCLAHTSKGFYATDDGCPHMHASLSEGRLNYLHEVICPLHGYRFNLLNGRECNNRTRDARTFKVELNDDGLFIYLPE